jgi:hypothetical protein
LNDREPPPDGRRAEIGHLEEVSACPWIRRWSERSTPDRVDIESGFVMRRSHLAFIAAIVVLVAGLALGAGKSEADTSIANSASKILLTLGTVGLVAAAIVVAIGWRRARRAER